MRTAHNGERKESEEVGMEELITIKGILKNLNDYNPHIGQYRMSENEVKLVKPCVAKGIVKKAEVRGGVPYCTECGNEMMFEWMFCPYCGQRLKEKM